MRFAAVRFRASPANLKRSKLTTAAMRFPRSIFLCLLIALAFLSPARHLAAQSPQPDSTVSPAPAPVPNLTPDASGKLSQEQMQKLFRVVADKDMANDKLLRNYTYTEREVVNKLDGKGKTKSSEEREYEILEIYGEQVDRLIEKDNKPLPAKEAEKEEEKIQKIIDKRKNESESDRKKREEKEEKDREEGREFVRDVADAYNFTLVGSETIGGRDAWVIDGVPRSDFTPHARGGRYLSKFRGRVWIDKADLQLAKLQMECLDTISWGLFLARFHKGSRFTLEQTRVNDEVWLPLHLTAAVDARLALFKSVDADVDQSFRDYKKFRATAKIVGIGQVKEN
jgi:hypothetical protein